MISEEENKIVKNIINESGNSFHSKVAGLLKEEGWSVSVSPYYSDNFTDKPREIDILAEKVFNVQGMGSFFGSVKIQLFIECKYIAKEVVFWFDKKDEERALNRISRDTGMNDIEIKNGTEKHHYFTGDMVAKLFSSNSGKIEENDPINKAINQNLNATIYYRHKDLTNLKNKNVIKTIPVPIIVVNSFDKLYKTSMSNTDKVEKIIEPFQLEINYAYKDNNTFIDEHRGVYRNEYFLIDVVALDMLAEFLSFIEKNDLVAIKGKIVTDNIFKENHNTINNNYDPYE